MREQHFTEIGVNDLPALAVGDGQRRVLQRQSLHLGGIALLGFKRDQRRAQRRHGKPQFLRKAETVAGRAGERIGSAARRYNDAVMAVHAVCLHKEAVPFGTHGADSRVHKVYTRIDGIAAKRLGNVRRLIRDRENAVSPLGLERHAVLFKKRLDVGGREGVQRRVQKPRIAALHMLDDRVHIAVVADIAAPLARDAQLLAAKRIFFIKRDGSAARGGVSRRHQTGSAAADHSNLRHQPCTFA